MDEFRAFFPTYLRNIERPLSVDFECKPLLILHFINSRIGGRIEHNHVFKHPQRPIYGKPGIIRKDRGAFGLSNS